MTVTLYYHGSNFAVRSVLMTASILNITTRIQMYTGNPEDEQPQLPFTEHDDLILVPALKDDDYYIFQSYAINGYLVYKYGKGDSLYPERPSLRAAVDQILFYDSGFMTVAVIGVLTQIKLESVQTISAIHAIAFKKIYTYLNQILKYEKYIAGNKFTIADIVIANTLELMNAFYPIDSNIFNYAFSYLEKCGKKIPGYYLINKIFFERLIFLYRPFIFPNNERMAKINATQSELDWLPFYLKDV